MEKKSTIDEPDVTREDQMYINEFSRLYTKNKLKDKELKELKEQLDLLADAEQAIEESLGNKIKLTVGESFFETEEDDAKTFVANQKNKLMQKNQEAKAIFDSTKKRLDELKIILYAKFGNRLRLEEE